MDRRKSLKILTLGALSAGILTESCDHKQVISQKNGMEGMEGMHHEGAETGFPLSDYDKGLMKEIFFSEYEMKQISTLTNLIIPPDEHFGGALDAKVPAFIEFMVKDQPQMQIPIRGGLRWIDIYSDKMFGKSFIDLTESEQKNILDKIAYPKKAKPELVQGISFFSTMRDLTASGYFSSEIGVKYLGYIGNVANVWDGPPQEVLTKLGVEYDPKLLPKYVKPSDRATPMIFS